MNAAERGAVGAVTELSGGRGGGVALEVIGLKETIEATIGMVRPAARPSSWVCPHGRDARAQRRVPFLYLNKTVKGCWYGSVNVHEDVPKLLDLWKQGRLKLELISQEITVADVNEAFGAMERGEVARSVIRY